MLAGHDVDGLLRMLDPALEASTSFFFHVIAGAEAYNYGETDDPGTVGMRAVDEYTLEITLEYPASYFDALLPWVIPLRLDVIEERGESWTEPGSGTSPSRTPPTSARSR